MYIFNIYDFLSEALCFYRNLWGNALRKPLRTLPFKPRAACRAGYIKPVANGIFSLTSPAQLMAKNIEDIIRDEMNKIDGQEVKFPVVMPRELWEQSGRYSSIGSEMVRFKDRSGKDMLLGMTHEEAAVHLAKTPFRAIISFRS